MRQRFADNNVKEADVVKAFLMTYYELCKIHHDADLVYRTKCVTLWPELFSKADKPFLTMLTTAALLEHRGLVVNLVDKHEPLLMHTVFKPEPANVQ
jgi:hypothetical protein